MGTILVTVLGAVLYGSTVILPIFLQGLLGYTALLSGMAVSPRGFGSIFSMMIMGKLVRKIDNRFLVALGFLGIAATCWILSHLTLEIIPANVSWPLVLNGFSMGFIFVPMTTLAMATLRQDRIYQATGIYSLLRNTGGGLGISLLMTMQARAAQTHQAVMVSNLTPYSFAFQQQIQKLTGAFRGLGALPGQAAQMANGAVYGSLVKQALLLSFMDCFRWMAILCLLCVPTVMLFQKVKGGRVVTVD